MATLEQFKKQAFKNPNVKRHYDELGPEYEMITAIMRKRIKKGLTQAQLAHKMGTQQSAIARLESGSYNPSFSMLRKVADALDAKLTISIS